MLDVIGLGAVNLDTYILVSRFPDVDDETVALSMLEKPGGSAANTVVGLARLGAKTGFIGKVGDDSAGKYLLAEFVHENVDTRGVKIINASSGKVFVVLDKKGDKKMICAGIANSLLCPEDIDAEYLKEAKYLHITSLVGRRPFQTTVYAAGEARSLGVKVCVDPGVIFAEIGMKNMKELLRNTDVFLPSQLELSMITNTQDYKKGAEKLLDYVDTIVVKLAGNGCYVRSAEDDLEIPAFPAKPVDSTGSGDAFCSGFIYGLLQNKSMRQCGLWGNAAGALSTRRQGAREALPTLDELKKLLSKKG
jgi:ribokinase